MIAPLTVAAVQCAPINDDVAGASAHVLASAHVAARAGARLILFPECHLQGHSYDAATVARRAMSLDDPAVLDLAQALATLEIVTIVGLFERRGGAIYNSAVVLADGKVLGAYAKHEPREGGCTPGTDLPIFHCGEWPFALSICRDTRSSALALDLSARGARLLCYPLGNMLPQNVADDWRTRHGPVHAQRARETGCWVLTSDVVGTAGDWRAYGNTRLFRPDGTMAAEVPDDETGIIIATIDPVISGARSA